MFGDAWVPEPVDKPVRSQTHGSHWPDVVDFDVAELPGEEYVAVTGAGIFHTLPPRHGGADPEASLAARPGFKINVNDARPGAFPDNLPEDEEVLGEMPEEPVRTGWSSMAYIQPAGYCHKEVTIFKRGFYGAP